MKTHERFQWATTMMGIKPQDNILEIGCGVGFAVEALVPLLKTGKITAIDKSQIALNRGVQRNKEAILQGKAKFLQADLLALANPQQKYSKVFSFNVNLFWTKTSIAEECEVIKSMMAKHATLYLFYGPLMGNVDKIADAVSTNLKEENFRITKRAYEDRLKCYWMAATQMP